MCDQRGHLRLVLSVLVSRIVQDSFLLLFGFGFETGSHYVAQAGLELMGDSPGLSLLSAEITGALSPCLPGSPWLYALLSIQFLKAPEKEVKD